MQPRDFEKVFDELNAANRAAVETARTTMRNLMRELGHDPKELDTEPKKGDSIIFPKDCMSFFGTEIKAGSRGKITDDEKDSDGDYQVQLDSFPSGRECVKRETFIIVPEPPAEAPRAEAEPTVSPSREVEVVKETIRRHDMTDMQKIDYMRGYLGMESREPVVKPTAEAPRVEPEHTHPDEELLGFMLDNHRNLSICDRGNTPNLIRYEVSTDSMQVFGDTLRVALYRKVKEAK